LLSAVAARYLWVYILVIKSFLVYISDIYTATTMLTSKDWSNKIFTACQDPNGCVAIPFSVAKWLFVGCIIFSFLLVRICIHDVEQCLTETSWHTRLARPRRSSPVATFPSLSQMSWPKTTTAFVCFSTPDQYLSLTNGSGSYDHFCFFCHIEDSTKKKDDFAFFIFFTFKGNHVYPWLLLHSL